MSGSVPAPGTVVPEATAELMTTSAGLPVVPARVTCGCVTVSCSRYVPGAMLTSVGSRFVAGIVASAAAIVANAPPAPSAETKSIL
nr:hypothetical protein [Pengzhenrongella sicca]